MRIAILQLEPKLGDVEGNLKQAHKILDSSRIGGRKLRAHSKSRQGRRESKSQSRSEQLGNELQPERGPQQNLFDLLLLPELAFSGSHQKVSTNAEPTSSGPSSLWAHTMSSKYDCVVTVGYPERGDPVTNKCYNSAITVYGTPDSSRLTQTQINYRQTRLDYMSQVWASPGTGFWNGNLPSLGKVTIGIGWDIMPEQNDFAFANHIVRNESDLVIIPMNFLGHAGQEEAYDHTFIKFLCKSLRPVAYAKRETIVVAGNSCGTQGKYTYAGSSAVLGLGNGLVKIYNVLGRGQRSLLVVDTLELPIYVWEVNDMTKTAQEAPSPSNIHQFIYDQQEVQSLVNSSIESLNIFQNISRQDHAAQQGLLEEIRQLASVELSLTHIIKSGVDSGVADNFLNQLLAQNVHIERYLREAGSLIEKLDKKNKSIHEHYEKSIKQIIKFLGKVELVDIVDVIEETDDGTK